MASSSMTPPTERLRARDLRRLPPAERSAILESAAAQAEGEYRSNPDLAGFEAFGKDDLHGDSANSETR